MERFFLNLKMQRVWYKGYANHAEATNDIATTLLAFAIASSCTQNWAKCRPTLLVPIGNVEKYRV